MKLPVLSDPEPPSASKHNPLPLKFSSQKNDGSESTSTSGMACCEDLIWKVTWATAFPWLSIHEDAEGEDDECWRTLAWNATFRRCQPYLPVPRKIRHHPNISKLCLCPSAVKNCIPTTADSSWTDSLGYGEIELHSIWTVILEWNIPSDSLKCLVDLGSGSGLALLAASWRLSSPRRPLKLIGLELDSQWKAQAEANFDRLYGSHYVGFYHNYDSSLDYCRYSKASTVKCSFRTADFTVETSWIDQADFVLCHATVFQDELVERVSELCAQCRPGTYFCLVSRPLKSPMLQTIRHAELEMSWGLATVYLQQRCT